MLLFGLTFVINFLLSLRQIHVSQPVELLHGGAQGEREPKTKLLTAVLGFMLLGVGYYLALTCQSSMDALDKFLMQSLWLWWERTACFLLEVLHF